MQACDWEKYLINLENIPLESLPLPLVIQEFIILAHAEDFKTNPFDSKFMAIYGGSTGIAWSPKHGWALLGTGQGPFVIWEQKSNKDRSFYKE